jgi:hypothetical protein
LPSDTLTHQALYQALLDTTLQVKKALSIGDTGSLSTLAPIHRQQMADLMEYGSDRNFDVRTLVLELQRQVDDVVIELKKQKSHLTKQMRNMGKQRKLSSAYGRQAYGFRSANASRIT